ncbi:PREDICTED: golgin candidate 1-like isoform X2 [Lupinus angustifolius]|uniref:golgin candidate 1-like isoform X2 n=1 Tax=Lupinus angustifolius TaxID=3871 RepID=UPI00092F75B9|nr:PREDICTED: golgin candidate 1-like isoform X2 [Lupinus angustifolius]
MASWLKAAEDLFEVVDRRAKSVVNDLADEQSDSKSPASNGQGSQGKRTKSKSKAQKGLSKPSTIISDATDTTKEKIGTPVAPVDVSTLTEKVDLVAENDGSTSISTIQPNKEQQLTDSASPLLGTSLSNMLAEDVGKHEKIDVEVLATDSGVEVATVSENGEPAKENTSDIREEDSLSVSEGIKGLSEEPVNTGQIISSGDLEANQNMDQDKSESVVTDIAPNNDAIPKYSDVKPESIVNKTSQEDHKTDISPKKVEDQLDEAQGLLKTAKSTGQSKEARLARVCAGLSSRLQEYKSENSQLEELLTAERALSKSCEARIKQLQKDLSESKREVTRVESNMAEALTAKNAEIETLLSSMEAVKRQAALSEGNLASMQASMESMMRNRELSETRMMQALREELASAERRAEEERAAHNATKMAAMGREVELEQRAVQSSTALARIQRIADERTAKATELEQKVALLEVECSSLNQELQDMEARVRREQKKPPEEANQVIQMQAWQEEMERARQGQREAENKLSSLEAEMQKMRVEMAAMKRDAEHYSRQEHMDLEKRYRELTDLLYYKQTQLETMASEKAAAEFQMEKEIKRLQETQAEAERSRFSRRASTSWEEESDIRSLESLPLHHRHMAGASMQLQKAVKLLDSGAVRATRFLWRYPKARVGLFFYLVFVHLFLMYLLHRLQAQAEFLASREVAESMGLSNHSLP